MATSTTDHSAWGVVVPLGAECCERCDRRGFLLDMRLTLNLDARGTGSKDFIFDLKLRSTRASADGP